MQLPGGFLVALGVSVLPTALSLLIVYFSDWVAVATLGAVFIVDSLLYVVLRLCLHYPIGDDLPAADRVDLSPASLCCCYRVHAKGHMTDGGAEAGASPPPTHSPLEPEAVYCSVQRSNVLDEERTGLLMVN